MTAHRDYLADTGALEKRRAERRRAEFLETVQEELYRRITERLEGDTELGELLRQIDGKVAEPYGAAMELLRDGAGMLADFTGQ